MDDVYFQGPWPQTLESKAAAHFDSKVIDPAVTKLRLPHNLLSGARLSLTLPIRFGGFGLRSTVRVSNAAYWSGLAQAAPDILAATRNLPAPASVADPPPPPRLLPQSSLSFMQALSGCYASFTKQCLPSSASPLAPGPYPSVRDWLLEFL